MQLQYEFSRVLESLHQALESVPVAPSGMTPTILIAIFSLIMSAVAAYISVTALSPELSTPDITVETTELESKDAIDAPIYTPGVKSQGGGIPCYDPSTMHYLGEVPAMGAEEVRERIGRAREAAVQWRDSSFAQRRLLLRTLLKFILREQKTICRVAARDSGKAMVDAGFGELIVTCEKIRWLLKEGERWLRPERRGAGIMMFYKSARVEYRPVGVVGAIVPWNYPFHNVFNPLTAAVMAGDAIVIKVSEHASWSSQYYGRVIAAALEAARAPADLVQIVTGYGEAGNVLVTGGVDKLIFVGSTAIGKKVMAAAAETLTPVVLELGGKDAFIVCDDADLNQVVPTALRATFQSCGQNCAGAERFFVHEKVYDEFVDRVVEATKKIRQGPALGSGTVDCGAMCMPGLTDQILALVDDAVGKGAQVKAGGRPGDGPGQFFQPTVLVGVTPQMRIWHEEVFGPVLTVVRVSNDSEAIRLANDCPFGLGSNVFSRNTRRANAIAASLEAGMTSINDFATTYMCQSLPFGGVKHSGFDRFAGIEGLRGMCYPKAVCEDAVPWLMRTDIPPPLRYPVHDIAFDFVAALCNTFYGFGLWQRAGGLLRLAQCFVLPSTVLPGKAKGKAE
uniref:Aldehyde dehydrogenase n=1 Tax=Tetraselmis sp. GSL018 TaxID=582737 RepID=A0A061RL47_9CHLO|eukprot:CAMPEP_0177584214 /NCGR_PEP_ID=MMETSP0419_2-20121207/3775_1 /TAXON_ID=582737 /ORGANISM="Tetraselmis sp., Strain GSL018" /LENGTH=621 /DNA_ID=CAMNT_0019073735 /DNA_START=68 /DNA_END=1933 /DNA_ORIENTATION=-